MFCLYLLINAVNKIQTQNHFKTRGRETFPEGIGKQFCLQFSLFKILTNPLFCRRWRGAARLRTRLPLLFISRNRAPPLGGIVASLQANQIIATVTIKLCFKIERYLKNETKLIVHITNSSHPSCKDIILRTIILLDFIQHPNTFQITFWSRFYFCRRVTRGMTKSYVTGPLGPGFSPINNFNWCQKNRIFLVSGNYMS